VTPSGHFVDLRALAVGTQRQGARGCHGLPRKGACSCLSQPAPPAQSAARSLHRLRLYIAGLLARRGGGGDAAIQRPTAAGATNTEDLEARLFERPVITVPTVTIGSDFDGAAADGRVYAEKVLRRVFASSPRRHRTQCAPRGPWRVHRRHPRSGERTAVNFFSNLRRAGSLPVAGYLPGFDRATVWLNSPPLGAAGLQGRSFSSISGPIPASTGSARSLMYARGPRNTRIRGWSWSASTPRIPV
jgi:hypothetical protein